MLRLLPLAAILFCVTTTAQAQRRSATVYVPTKSMQGEIIGIQGSRLIWEADGKKGPIPYDQSTSLNVYASGDPGFVVPGAVVTVQGTLRPDKSIIGASLTVHTNPSQTAAVPGRVTVNANDPQISVKGRLVSINPMVIKAIDGVSMVAGAEGQRAGANVPPTYDMMFQVKLRDPKPDRVSVVLGSAPRLIEVGDSVTVTVRQDRPNVASAISIRKSTVLKSGRIKPEGDKKDGEKKEDAKKEDAKEDGEKTEDGEKPAEADAKMKDEKAEEGKSAEGKSESKESPAKSAESE